MGAQGEDPLDNYQRHIRRSVPNTNISVYVVYIMYAIVYVVRCRVEKVNDNRKDTVV